LKPSKKKSRLGWIIVGIFVFIVWAIGSNNNEKAPIANLPKSAEQIAAEAEAKAKNDAERAREEAAFQKTVKVASVVKQSLRDPDSLIWESIRANDDASVICLEYRARNGFGGMNR